MNSDNSTSSGSLRDSPSGNPAEPELFALDLLSETALGGHTTLARNTRTGKEMALPDEVMNAISYLDCFKTLDEHVQGFLDDGPSTRERAQAIASVIESVRRGGLTLSAREICERLAPATQAESPEPELPVVVIITCDRPPALKRLLDSLVVECDPAGIKRCVVVDDSRSPENQRKNRDITNQVNQRADLDIACFGEQEAAEFTAALVRRLPGLEHQIRFLIDRERWKDYFTVGVARNFSLLLSAGDPLIVFDDDTICKAYQSPYVQNGVEFSDRQRQAEFFPATREPGDAGGRAIADPVQQHMRCLGLTVPAALAALGTGTPLQSSLRHAQPGFASTLNRQSRILITECGTLGDPGIPGNNWLATLPTESRERLLRSEIQFNLAFRERNCWLGVSTPTFRSKALISQVTGFENRECLPPYFPIERGEDRIFGAMTRFVFQESVCLNYPWAIIHSPITPRQWASESVKISRSDLPALSLVAEVIKDAGLCSAEDPSVRLAQLAQGFQNMADSPENTILEQYSEACLQNRKSWLATLQETLEDSRGAPAFWTDYLKRSVLNSQSALYDKADLSRLTPSNGRPGGRQNIGFWQTASAEFGQSVQAWPAIRQQARSIIEAHATPPL